MFSRRSLAVALGSALACAAPAVAALDPTTPQLRGTADLTWVAQGAETINDVQVAGDINGDGRDDILVGASDGGSRVTYIAPGRAAPGVVELGLPGSGVVNVDPSSPGGTLIATLGDVDGDGYSDFAMRPDEPGAFDLVFGGPDLTALRRARVTTGTADLKSGSPFDAGIGQTDEELGIQAGVASAGDVDGDGIGDILFGRFGSEVRQGGLPSSPVEYFIVPGRSGLGAIDLSAPPTGTRTFTEPANSSNVSPEVQGVFSSSRFTQAFAADVTGDGLSDVAIARKDRNDPSTHRVHVIPGSAKPVSGGALDDQAQIIVRGVSQLLDLSSGDANGDGVTDLIVADSAKAGSVAVYGRADLLQPTSPDPNLDTSILAAGVDAGDTAPPAGEWIPDGLTHDDRAQVDVRHRGFPGGIAFTADHNPVGCRDGFNAEASGVIYNPSTPGGGERTVVLPGNGGIRSGDINGDGVADLVSAGLPFTRAGAKCPARERQVKVVLGGRLPVCAGALLPGPQALESLAGGASLRAARRASVKVSIVQLRANQRIAADAIRRLNAVRDWLDAGIEGRDICGDALGEAEFAAGTVTASAPLTERPAPDPRPVVVAEPENGVAEMTLSQRQLLINQRIYQAAIARANALGVRLASLTGGDVKDGTIARRALRGDLSISGGTASGVDPSVTKIVAPSQRDIDGLALSKAQLLINHRIALEVQLRAQNMQARLEQGLIGENFADGALTPVDLAQ